MVAVKRLHEAALEMFRSEAAILADPKHNRVNCEPTPPRRDDWQKAWFGRAYVRALSEAIESEWAKEIANKLDNVTFGFWEEFLMKWDAFFTSGNYKENYRTSKGERMAKAVDRTNINNEGFLEDMAKAMGKLDSKELNDVLEVIYELLGDTDERRDCFIKKLIPICAQEVKSKAEEPFDKKLSLESGRNFQI
jgi:hypothetical protein